MKWKCLDGRELEISEMHTDHIKNCVAMMRREGFCTVRELAQMFAMPRDMMGEMAADALDRELDDVKASSALEEMEEELERRNS